jgi:hypothetical protein
MFGLPWWVWAITGSASVVAILALARRAYRARIRRQFLAFLKENYPDINAAPGPGGTLLLEVPGEATGTWYLHKIYSAIANIRARDDTPEARTEIYRHFVEAMLPSLLTLEKSISLDDFGDRILPRLVPRGWLVQISQQMEIPSRPISDLGLAVVYVIDFPGSVRFLSKHDLSELNMTFEALDKRAMANLRNRFSGDVVRKVIDDPTLVTVASQDSFDAARLLLVPENLEEGEELVALIPDRDTLTLLPMPKEEHWNMVRDLPRGFKGDHLLLDRPIVVSKNGYRVV